jgi:hypothetical protein
MNKAYLVTNIDPQNTFLIPDCYNKRSFTTISGLQMS